MPARMKMRQVQQPMQGVDMSSLLDVVFILLIFFIVSSVFVKDSGIEVDKPSAVSASDLPKKVIYLTMDADGRIFFEGNEINLKYVRHQLKPMFEQAQRPVVIETDRQVTTHTLMALIDEVKLSGAQSVNLAAVKK